MTEVKILIQNKDVIYEPILMDDVQWSTDRYGAAGKLTFKVLKDSILNITEGNSVVMSVDGAKVFYGFIFKQSNGIDNVVTITAYDQIVYLVKNKDTYVFEGKTADQIIKNIAGDFQLQCGELESTVFKIQTLTEDSKGLCDIIQDALDQTLTNTGNMFVLYDNVGKLTLKNVEHMVSSTLVCNDTAMSYSYETSIDGDTYDKIKLIYDNDQTGQRDVYIAKDSGHINEWGVLQYYDKIQKGENGQVKADSLLKLYNAKSRKLKISDAFGAIDVRAGSMIPVVLELRDTTVSNYMLVEKCTHKFSEGIHTMDLTLRGGEFIA